MFRVRTIVAGVAGATRIKLIWVDLNHDSCDNGSILMKRHDQNYFSFPYISDEKIVSSCGTITEQWHNRFSEQMFLFVQSNHSEKATFLFQELPEV